VVDYNAEEMVWCIIHRLISDFERNNEQNHTSISDIQLLQNVKCISMIVLYCIEFCTIYCLSMVVCLLLGCFYDCIVLLYFIVLNSGLFIVYLGGLFVSWLFL